MPTSYQNNNPSDYTRAAELRRQSSYFEQRLWQELRKLSYKFRRQQPIHPYIVDFVCMKSRVVIELDGPSHDATQEHDVRRDTYLRKLGYVVLRFANDDVRDNLEGVVATIVREVEKRRNPLTNKN